ncbi:MAG TPA: hypothetical protein VJU86_14175 [Pyrinomonadaceae bacterium]|nr:hypothetical protein [Pyrinomonadaceae bacterium]
MPKQEKVNQWMTSLSDPLRPYVPQHQTSYDFTTFAHLGKAFVIALVRVFATRAGGLAKCTAKSDCYALRILLRWIEANGKHFPAFSQKLFHDYQSILVDEWEVVLNTWRDDLVNGKHRQSETTRAQTIRTVNVLLEALVAARIMRPISRLAPVKNSNKKSTPKKCLAEVSSRSLIKEANTPVCGADRESVSADDLSSPDAIGIAELKDGAADHVEALAHLNQARLTDLRRCAEKELKKWSEHFREGQRLVGLCDMPFSQIKEVLHARYKNNTTRRWALTKLFPRDLPHIALSRYLTYILHERGGLIPFGKKTRLHSFHRYFCKSRGGIDKLRAYLIPHPEAANAARIIFQVDTGANVAVCHSLTRDCLSDSDLREHKVIAGFKDRARGKLIVSELPIKDARYEVSCVQALEIYREMSKPLSDCAPTKLKDALFLHHYKENRVGVLSFSSAERQFQGFLARHKEFYGMRLTADMIRPTVLFQATYKNDGSLLAANALGDHSSLATTSAYASKPAMRLLYARLIREFQLLFQVVSVSDIQGAAKKLQMTDMQFRSLLKKANQTGLGIACLNPKAGYQPGTTKGKNCAKLERCPSCPLRFVIATVPNLTDLILFYSHLRKNRLEFEATRPQRWVQTWLPWLVFAEIALEKAQRGPSAAIYLRAKMAAEARIEARAVNLPPLW